MSKNSGSHNAGTGPLETNYYFDCVTSGFQGALDRFSQFFVAPLFNEDCVDREMNAVNSEYLKNIKLDLWRFKEITRITSNSDSEFKKFSTGNLATLKQPGIRERLIEFYKSNYSANLMKLVMVSNLGLDVQEQYAKEFFSAIENRNLERRTFAKMPFTKENLSRLIKITPLKESNQVRNTQKFRFQRGIPTHTHINTPDVFSLNQLSPLPPPRARPAF